MGIAAPVQQTYENLVGHLVHHSGICRALHRQGWRKVQLRLRHPKTDLAVQGEFKRSFRSWSRWK